MENNELLLYFNSPQELKKKTDKLFKFYGERKEVYIKFFKKHNIPHTPLEFGSSVDLEDLENNIVEFMLIGQKFELKSKKLYEELSIKVKSI